jgi:hypothetical protein
LEAPLRNAEKPDVEVEKSRLGYGLVVIDIEKTVAPAQHVRKCDAAFQQSLLDH